MKFFRVALSFLTILPTRSIDDYQKGDLGRSAALFPWIGLLIGAITAGMTGTLQLFLPPTVTAVLAAFVWNGLSGFLHLDGLADCADALPYAGSIERRLDILKDSRIGSFAAVSLIIFFALKISLLASLIEDWTFLVAIILYTMTLSRWLLVLVAFTQPNARPGGMGDEFQTTLTRNKVIAASILPVLLTILGSVFLNPWFLIAFFLTPLFVLWLTRIVKTRLGGITGDVLGMIVELSELFILLCFSIQ